MGVLGHHLHNLEWTRERVEKIHLSWRSKSNKRACLYLKDRQRASSKFKKKSRKQLVKPPFYRGLKRRVLEFNSRMLKSMQKHCKETVRERMSVVEEKAVKGSAVVVVLAGRAEAGIWGQELHKFMLINLCKIEIC